MGKRVLKGLLAVQVSFFLVDCCNLIRRTQERDNFQQFGRNGGRDRDKFVVVGHVKQSLIVGSLIVVYSDQLPPKSIDLPRALLSLSLSFISPPTLFFVRRFFIIFLFSFHSLHP